MEDIEEIRKRLLKEHSEQEVNVLIEFIKEGRAGEDKPPPKQS
tara:strand:+ start:749 stop:877 length:129 start_codon:yes stop_codon:yes gene_type:complete